MYIKSEQNIHGWLHVLFLNIGFVGFINYFYTYLQEIRRNTFFLLQNVFLNLSSMGIARPFDLYHNPYVPGPQTASTNKE